MEKGEVNTDDNNNNNYMNIMLAKFIFGGSVMIRQLAEFSFPPKFVVIHYLTLIVVAMIVLFLTSTPLLFSIET